MFAGKDFSLDEARRVGEQLGIDWDAAPFGVEEFCRGMNVELEHGLRDPLTDVTHDDPVLTGKIVLAHLSSVPDYYTRLERIEGDAADTPASPPQIELGEPAGEPVDAPRRPARSNERAVDEAGSPASLRAADEETVVRGDDGVVRWRLDQLVRAGYERADAERVARRTEIDLHDAIDLVRRGCPPELAQSILL